MTCLALKRFAFSIHSSFALSPNWNRPLRRLLNLCAKFSKGIHGLSKHATPSGLNRVNNWQCPYVKVPGYYGDDFITGRALRQPSKKVDYNDIHSELELRNFRRNARCIIISLYINWNPMVHSYNTVFLRHIYSVLIQNTFSKIHVLYMCKSSLCFGWNRFI